MRRTQLLCFAMAMLALPSLALAGSTAVIPDTFSPTSVTRTINVGDSFDVTKTMTIGARDADTPVDIMFLFDTTNSFAPYFGSSEWMTTAASLVSQATGKFNDVQFAIAQYEDFPSTPWGAGSDDEYNLLQGFSGSAANTTTALQGMLGNLGVGGDDPESNLVALNAAAGEGWRSDSVKILIWVGDQPGHVPGESGTGSGAVIVTYPGTVDTDDVIAALKSGDILAEGFDFGSLDADLRDMNGAGPLLDTAQATAITGATGGDLWTVTTSSTDPAVGLASLLSLYGTALDEAFALYNLGLDVSNLPAGLSLSIVPPGSTSGDRTTINGDFETYQWVLTFTGNTPGTYLFPIYGMIDGGILDTEWDEITVLKNGVTPGPEIPEPTTFALLGLGLLGVGVMARRRKK